MVKHVDQRIDVGDLFRSAASIDMLRAMIYGWFEQNDPMPAGPPRWTYSPVAMIIFVIGLALAFVDVFIVNAAVEIGASLFLLCGAVGLLIQSIVGNKYTKGFEEWSNREAPILRLLDRLAELDRRPVHVSLSAEDFRELVRGQIVTQDITFIALQDIGWDRMSEILADAINDAGPGGHHAWAGEKDK